MSASNGSGYVLVDDLTPGTWVRFRNQSAPVEVRSVSFRGEPANPGDYGAVLGLALGDEIEELYLDPQSSIPLALPEDREADAVVRLDQLLGRDNGGSSDG
jgi:hypothetical protein